MFKKWFIAVLLLAAISAVPGSAQTAMTVTMADQTNVYQSGVTYTAGAFPLMEAVTMAGPGPKTVGCNYLISSTIGSLTGPSQGITSNTWGAATITFIVPAGETFSVTAEKASSGEWCGPPIISKWLEWAL
jgi:hypothetical protein